MERWKLNTYTIWFTQILSIMGFGFGLPFLAYYIQDMGIKDPDQIKFYTGLLNIAPAVTMAIMAPIWGRIADKYGKKLMVMRAVFAAAVVMILMGLCQNVWQLLACRILQGFFTGTIAASAALVASNTPEKNLSWALGFMTSSTYIGNSAGPALGGLVAEWFGYRSSFFIGGVVLILDFIIVLTMVQDNSHERPGLAKVAEGDDCPPKRRLSVSGWMIAALSMLLMSRIISSVFSPYMPILVQERLGTVNGASSTTGLINGFISIMLALSGIFLGKLGDKHNRVGLLRIYSACGLAFSIPLFFTQGNISLALLYGCMMFFLGAIEPTIMTITSSNVDRCDRGQLFGIQTFVSSIGWALAPVLGGWWSIRYSVHALLILLPILVAVQLGLAFFSGKRMLGHANGKDRAA